MLSITNSSVCQNYGDYNKNSLENHTIVSPYAQPMSLRGASGTARQTERRLTQVETRHSKRNVAQLRMHDDDHGDSPTQPDEHVATALAIANRFDTKIAKGARATKAI